MTLKNYILQFFSLICLILLESIKSDSNTCCPNITLQERVNRADVVIHGKVIDIIADETSNFLTYKVLQVEPCKSPEGFVDSVQTVPPKKKNKFGRRKFGKKSKGKGKKFFGKKNFGKKHGKQGSNENTEEQNSQENIESTNSNNENNTQNQETQQESEQETEQETQQESEQESQQESSESGTSNEQSSVENNQSQEHNSQESTQQSSEESGSQSSEQNQESNESIEQFNENQDESSGNQEENTQSKEVIYYVKTSRFATSCGKVELHKDEQYILLMRSTSKKYHTIIDSCIGTPLIAKKSFRRFKQKYCDKKPSVCVIPENCTKEYFPVCDIDGNTHANDCLARQVGAQVQCAHACPCEEICNWEIVD